MQTPSIGRIVLYKSHGSLNGEHPSVHRPAVVTCVHGDTDVGLAIFNPTGMYFQEHTSFGDGPGQWTWPVYVPAKGEVKALEAKKYEPPAELVEAAQRSLDFASNEELVAAEYLYDAYRAVTANRSAVTGAELPAFGACSVLVKAGWLATLRAARRLLTDPSPTFKPALAPNGNIIMPATPADVTKLATEPEVIHYQQYISYTDCGLSISGTKAKTTRDWKLVTCEKCRSK